MFGTINGFIVCISNIQYVECTKLVTRPNVIREQLFYHRIKPERLLYGAERDLLAIAKFLISDSSVLRLTKSFSLTWLALEQ